MQNIMNNNILNIYLFTGGVESVYHELSLVRPNMYPKTFASICGVIFAIGL